MNILSSGETTHCSERQWAYCLWRFACGENWSVIIPGTFVALSKQLDAVGHHQWQRNGQCKVRNRTVLLRPLLCHCLLILNVKMLWILFGLFYTRFCMSQAFVKQNILWIICIVNIISNFISLRLFFVYFFSLLWYYNA